MDLSYPVMNDLSLSVLGDITKKNKDWKEVTEITGESFQPVHLACGANS